MKIEIINSFYKKSFYGQYDLDLALVQTVSTLLVEYHTKDFSLTNLITSAYGNIDI
jgi:hypothetical protein